MMNENTKILVINASWYSSTVIWFSKCVILVATDLQTASNRTITTPLTHPAVNSQPGAARCMNCLKRIIETPEIITTNIKVPMMDVEHTRSHLATVLSS